MMCFWSVYLCVNVVKSAINLCMKHMYGVVDGRRVEKALGEEVHTIKEKWAVEEGE